MCVTCIDSVYVFNYRAILAEWFEGTDSKNEALVFGKLIHAGRCPAQTNITSRWVPVCRGGVHPHRGRDVGRSGGGHHPHHLVVWGGHCPEGWPTRLLVTTCTKHLFHRVATALWRGNSTLWMHRLPTLPPTVDGLL